ncbi:MAG TPA: hypothetical protein DDW34_12985 [Clostridium sp.]|nr:hypothetical protein [Clostridium sp.]
MARYIDVELLIEKIDEVAFEIDAYSLIIDAVEQAPTADVREVRRGKWFSEIGDAHSAGKYRTCSFCGENVFIPYFSKQGIENIDFDFCPNCGAVMEVE